MSTNRTGQTARISAHEKAGAGLHRVEISAHDAAAFKKTVETLLR